MFQPTLAGLVPLRIRVQWSDTTRPRNLSADVTIVNTHGNAAVNPQMREAHGSPASACFSPAEEHCSLWNSTTLSSEKNFDRLTDLYESDIDKSHQLTLCEHVGPGNIDDTSGTFNLGQTQCMEIMKAALSLARRTQKSQCHINVIVLPFFFGSTNCLN